MFCVMFITKICYIIQILILLYYSDIDECITSACGPRYKCINVPGYYKCACAARYKRSGSYCVGKWIILFLIVLNYHFLNIFVDSRAAQFVGQLYQTHLKFWRTFSLTWAQSPFCEFDAHASCFQYGGQQAKKSKE